MALMSVGHCPVLVYSPCGCIRWLTPHLGCWPPKTHCWMVCCAEALQLATQIVPLKHHGTAAGQAQAQDSSEAIQRHAQLLKEYSTGLRVSPAPAL
jgi:hypothetical protein